LHAGVLPERDKQVRDAVAKTGGGQEKRSTRDKLSAYREKRTQELIPWTSRTQLQVKGRMDLVTGNFITPRFEAWYSYHSLAISSRRKNGSTLLTEKDTPVC